MAGPGGQQGRGLRAGGSERAWRGWRPGAARRACGCVSELGQRRDGASVLKKN